MSETSPGTDRVELTEDEREQLDTGSALFGWGTREDALSELVAAVGSIVAARVQEYAEKFESLSDRAKTAATELGAKNDRLAAELASANDRIAELEAQKVADHETWLQEVEERDAMLIERDATLDRVTAVLDEWKLCLRDPKRRRGWSGGAVLADLRAALTPEGKRGSDPFTPADLGQLEPEGKP